VEVMEGDGRMNTGSAVVVAEGRIVVRVGSIRSGEFGAIFPSRIARDNPPSMVVLEKIAIKRPHKIVRMERILFLFFVFDAHGG
jgi:hypothetical protein